MALSDDILGSWWLNNNFTDASGNNNPIINSNITFDAINQILGSACGDFNGVNSRGTVPTINGTDVNGSFTVSMWINLNTLSAFDTFMGLGITTAGQHGFSFDGSNTANGLRIFIYDNGGTTDTITVANALLGLTGTWVNIGCTLDIDANTLKIYKSGVPIGSKVSTIEGIRNTAFNLRVGSISTVRFTDGLIDSPLFIERAWSDAEHLEYYNAGIGMELPTNGVILPLRGLGRGLNRGLGRGL